MFNRKPNSIVLGAFEGGEAVLDFLASNEAFKAVPIVSTAIRLLEGYKDFQSHLLQRKLGEFLAEPSLLRSLEAQRLRGDILGDPDELSSIGDTLFLIIAKMTDCEKPVILAKIYAFFLDHQISIEDFFLIAHCIDVCSLTDLRTFIAARGATHAISDAGKVRLVTAGLVTAESTNSTQLPTFPTVSGNTLRVYFEASDLGHRLIYAIDAAETP